MSITDQPKRTRPSRAPARPGTAPRRVGVEIVTSRPGDYDGVALPRTMTRRHLDELVRLEPALLTRLARRPEDRRAFLTDPAAVLRAAAPQASEGLVEAVRATHAAQRKLPSGVPPDRFDIGIEGLTPLRPRPSRPARPLPRVQVGALGGFDGCFAVGAGALGRALAELLRPRLATALDGLSIVGGQVLGVLGVVSVEVSPTVAIDAATGRARVEVTVAAELSVAGVGVELLDITVTLDVTVVRKSDAVEIGLADVGVDVQGLVGLLAPLLGPVVQAVTDALAEVFPITVPVDLPGGDPDFCDIGLRDLAVAFLPGQAGQTEPCLGLFTSLLPDSSGDLGAVASPLPAGADAGLFVDNFLLLSQIACKIQNAPELGLPAPTHIPQRTDDEPSFAWTGLNVEQEVTTPDGTETIEIHEVTVGIDPADPAAKVFVVAAELTVKRSLFRAHVDIRRIPITIGLADGAITVEVGEPDYDVTVSLTVLGWILAAAVVVVAAVVGVLIGGALIPGALIGGAVGGGALAVLIVALFAAVRAIVGNAIKNAAAGAAPPATQVVPPAVVELLGVLDVGVLVFDDLALTGTLVPVAPSLQVGRRTLSNQQQQVGDGDPDTVTFHLSRTVRLDAVSQRLEEPISHLWTLDGLPLAHGQPPPGSGISELSVAGRVVTMTNEFGSDVAGTVEVQATDAFGTALSRTVAVNLPGSITGPADLVPGPKPDPLTPADL